MNNALISVIIPVYNCEKYIKYAIESVFKQNYSNIEIIVINDGSTDHTLAVIQQFKDRIRIITQENRGQAVARNTGIKQAKGSIIGFLDSDDLWPDNHIECMLPYLTEDSCFDTVRGQIKLVKTIENEIIEISEIVSIPALTGALLFKASVFEKIGLFDETMREGEDTDWFVRFNSSSCKEKKITETTLFYRRHDNNMTNSSEFIKKSLFETIRRKLSRERTSAGIIKAE
jgi:glycosyltransferase involved in cell wall biosynthesis